MIDIHHHLLWGLDDGSTSLETSVEMAAMAAQDGITHIVCTPHANSEYSYDPAVVEAKIATLQASLNQRQIPITLGRGCDFHLSYDNVQQALHQPGRFSINGLGYLLIELPDYGLSQALPETLYQLRLAGMTPILTHPERNATLQADPDRMIEWLRSGLLLQVTASSVTGQMGRRAQKVAWQLLERRWVHFLATDAHNLGSRPPRMRQAHDLVAEKLGPEYAHALCLGNPLAAFKGKPLALLPEPDGVFDDNNTKPWWKRVLGR
ncbi:MAG: exopolysaccharide biosynthesis protein [Acidobacteriota bacterium]|nr:exopolysaccharide biosynthesis protein [Acidobacteriota bacterium]